MNLCSKCAFDYMAIGNDAIDVDEEAAATREVLTTNVEGFNGYRGWLNAPDEFWERVLGSNWSGRKEKNN